ncbi:MAG TPA: hypothetical protein VF883_03720 [Thermoanaerobaculia bacterium]
MPIPSTAPANAARDRVYPRLLLALMLLGAVLRLWQWAAGGSLWLDEISLARNILGRSLGELLTPPLAYDQVAPPGFLAAVKLSTLAFGGGERAFWLVPLIAGLVALVLFRRLAERILRGLAVPLAVALFAVAAAMIRYSAEVKQYGLDAAAAIGLTLLAFDLRARDRTTGELLLAGAAGLAVIWFSQASALVMAGLGAALAIVWLLERDRRTGRALLTTVPIWAVASLIAVITGARSMTPATRAFMQDFWRGGFLPLPPRLSTAASWLWECLRGLFADPWTLRYPFAAAFGILALLGIVALWRQRRDAALLIAAPFVVSLLAATAQQYPFRTRLVVFLIPSALLAVAAGAGWIADLAGRRSTIAAAALAILAFAPPAYTLIDGRLPLRIDDYAPLYAHLQANRRPDDVVYVSFLANSSAIYYGPRFGLQRADYHLGACDRNDTRAFLRDLDRFRGRPRVWLLTKPSPGLRIPRETMRRYLATIGTLRDELKVRSAVGDPLSLELYDLSDPARLRTASAATFPAPEMLKYPKPGCRDWSGDARPRPPASASR